MNQPNVPVRLDIRPNGVAALTLNRPKAMNALNQELVGMLENRFHEAETHPDVKVIAFMGAGDAFVAGADIKFFIKHIREKRLPNILAFTRRTSELFLSIEQSKKLTVAVLDGFSLGGGSELALACQTIIATQKGSLGFPETTIGIYPGLGGMFRLARKIGPALAKYYIFTGSPIPFNDAFNLGLFEKIISEDQVDMAVADLAKNGAMTTAGKRHLSGTQKEMEALFSGGTPLAERSIQALIGNKAPLAVKIANDIMDEQVGKTVEDALEIELNRIEEIFSTGDALEGLTSIGKKEPLFKGA